MCQLAEDTKIPNKAINGEQLVKRLRKELNEKEDELIKIKLNVNVLADSNALLTEKLSYMEKQVKQLTARKMELYENVEKLKEEFEERGKMLDYLTTTNKELDEHVKDLRSQLNKSGSVLDSSYDYLNNSSSDSDPIANSSKWL